MLLSFLKLGTNLRGEADMRQVLTDSAEIFFGDSAAPLAHNCRESQMVQFLFRVHSFYGTQQPDWIFALFRISGN